MDARLHGGSSSQSPASRWLAPGSIEAPDLPPLTVTPFSFNPPDQNVAGSDYTNSAPPDPVGDVGSLHYVQAVNHYDPFTGNNGAQFTIHDKTNPAVIEGPYLMDSLPGASPYCVGGRGDPIVLHDGMADRWILSERGDDISMPGGASHVCVYVSKTPDPSPATGGYYAYDIPLQGHGNDFPHLTAWPDAFYLTVNDAWPAIALERSAMLAGLPARVQIADDAFTVPFTLGPAIVSTLTSADLDGPLPPPAGAPGLFMRSRDDELNGAIPPNAVDPASDFLELWEYHVDWATPANTTLSGPTEVPVSEFDSHLCSDPYRCFPQPSGLILLESNPGVVNWRLQYRNFGNHAVLVGTLETDVDGTDHGGLQWFVLAQDPPGTGTWALDQDGTFAPDSDHRFMSSIAMDGCGNIALGYSITSGTTYPSLGYVGRLESDPPGAMTTGEGILAVGTGSMDTFRFGDYSSMNVDEEDQCTFWLTGEYVPNTGDPDYSKWATRIAAFSFDTCVAVVNRGEVPDGSLRVIKETANPTLGVRLDWSAVTNTTTYNVYRGDIDSLFVGRVYNHAASGASGAGSCDDPNAFLIDPDDQADSTDFYYLVTAKICLTEGLVGRNSFGAPIPPGSGCP